MAWGAISAGADTKAAEAKKPLKGGWIELFNGRDTTGWMLRHAGGRNGWKAEDGILINTPPSTDIVTGKKFMDFELHIEFLVPQGSNSGVYLQGRYEIQVDDCYHQPLRSTMCGAIYNKVAPKENVAKPAGDWQAFDIVFHAAKRDKQGKIIQKARATVIFNGIKVIDDAEIDGLTGGALDDREGTPGPLMLQGDHGPVQYRNILIRPLK